jgi:hypothetical protein
MANHTLRSRTIELHTDEGDFTAGKTEWDYTVEQPEVLGNGDEQNSVGLLSQQEIKLGSTRAGIESGLWQPDIVESLVPDKMEIPTAESGDLKNLSVDLLAAINESTMALQSSVETKIN